MLDGTQITKMFLNLRELRYTTECAQPTTSEYNPSRIQVIEGADTPQD